MTVIDCNISANNYIIIVIVHIVALYEKTYGMCIPGMYILYHCTALALTPCRPSPSLRI